MLHKLNKTLFRKLILLLSITTSIDAFSQADHLKILPLSPNAAETAKYGEVPVSTFTGIPNISIPLYQITSGELNLPLSLTYHAGGNKVESISSWVGLAWNLGSIPSISRSVNGSPDEGPHGYFYKYNGRTIRDMFANYVGGYNSIMEDYLVRVRDEGADGEPDNFSLSLLGHTYKFFFNQDLQRFVTSPYSNVKIVFNGESFRVVDEDGTQYFFDQHESTATSTTTANSLITSSWMITRIVSATGRDEIAFDYNLENQFSRSIASERKEYILKPGNYNPSPQVAVTQFTSTRALTLRSITFKGGKINFTKNATVREDLPGAYALDRIDVLTEDDVKIKTFQFRYKYLAGGGGGPGCPIDDKSGQKWLLLTDLSEMSTAESSSLKHLFTYNESFVPPCRTSNAQDYWGYFNGALSNQQLLPTILYKGLHVTADGLYIRGADRSVVPQRTQFGILSRITYPTGGYTLFEYENNDTQESNAAPTYITESTYLAQEDPLPDNEQLPTYKEYAKIFEIKSIDSGVYASADIERMGVPHGTSGAQVIIRRTSPALPVVQLVTSSSFQDYYLPNGTYEIKAIFNQSPPKYQEFSVFVSWQRKAVPQDGIPGGLNNYLGGLRIRKTTSYDSSTGQPNVKKYTYRESLESSSSTGHSFLDHKFNYAYPLLVGNASMAQTIVLVTKSYSNQLQVSSSGSYAGYSRVYVTTNDSTQTGISQFDYSYRPDELFDDRWPFPPAQSTEAFRGQLLLQRDFHFKNGKFNILKELTFEYEDSLLTNQKVFAIKTNTELSIPGDGELGFPKFYPYELAVESPLLKKQTERNFDPLNQTIYTETQTNFIYNWPYKQLTSKSNKNSSGQIQTINYYRPYNLILTGEAETARQWLLSQNKLSAVLKEEYKTENKITGGKIIHYKNYDGTNLIKDHQTIAYKSDASNSRILFKDFYDNTGNLLQYHSDGGIFTSYLWGYKNVYPIAEIKNATYAQIVNALGSSYINNISNQASITLAELNALRATIVTKLPNSQITTYTYKPLTGVSTITDIKGLTTSYEYDGFGRLLNLKDKDGNIVTRYDYHYRH